MIGTLFADRTFPAETVDTVARDVVGVFAEGLGYALKRTLLLGRMREQIGKIREMMAEADMMLDEMFDAGMSIGATRSPATSTSWARPGHAVRKRYRMMGLLRGARSR